MFHRLDTDLLPPERFTNPFCYEPHPLCRMAAEEVQKMIPSLHLNEGKMFGVLVASDKKGKTGFIAAYSGQIDIPENMEQYFVPAVFDYLQPDGYFKTHEEEISAINREIDGIMCSSEYVDSTNRLHTTTTEYDKALLKAQEEIRIAKAKRDERRSQGHLSAEEELAMVHESQHMKAELHRMKKEWKQRVETAKNKMESYKEAIHNLKLQRRLKSDALQNWLFSHFIMLNARGERRSLLAIWLQNSSLARIGVTIPPSGTGECCEPKLLQYAFDNDLKPLCMAMFWWGPSPKTEIRHHQHFYPACNAKCKPLLQFMLQGLDVEENQLEKDHEMKLKIVYEDSSIIVVDKPAGMLSVPGKSNRESVKSLLMERYPSISGPMMVHRLDMATSGLMVVARNMEAYVNLQKQFAGHTISKRYVAVIGRVDIPQHGMIQLPLSPDINDRPRQLVDYANGKYAETEYEVLGTYKDEMMLALWPHTGRTHQLRVHCAHADGLNSPIKGDPLYGIAADRLYLHAEYLEFTHPVSGERMTFESHDFRKMIQSSAIPRT